jgi:hypothetical protein
MFEPIQPKRETGGLLDTLIGLGYSSKRLLD